MIGDKIKSRRIELGMSQEALAKLTGYDNRASISKIESGDIELGVSKVKVFADALNVSVAYLMGWDDTPKQDTSDLDEELLVLARNAKTLTKDQLQAIKRTIDAFKKSNEE